MNAIDKNKKTSDAIENNTNSTTKEAPAPDPYRWRYLFYILVLIVGVFIYLKRTKLFKFVKSIIRRIATYLFKEFLYLQCCVHRELRPGFNIKGPQ